MAKQHRKNKKSFFGRPVWQNSTKTIKVEPQRYYQPDTLKDVEEMVQEAIDTNTPIRAVGSGHSFSTAPKADGILLDTDKLKKLERYKYADKDNLFEVQGGIKVHDLNESLDRLGYCIPTMGGIDHQSVAGAISTGTHGSSLTFGGMSQMIRSIVLVTHDQNNPKKAKTYRIERSGERSITDTTNYEGPEIINDDNVFNAAVVCFGSMGIIFSYVLEVEKMYYLNEKKEVFEEWRTVKEKLKNRAIFEGHRSIFVQINPYPYKDKRISLVTYHDKYDHTDQNLVVERIKHKFWHRLKRLSRSFQFELASLFPFFVWVAIWRINKFPDYIPKFLNSAVKSQRDEVYINKGYEVMYQGLDYVKERAYDCEIALEMDKQDKYLETIDRLMQYLSDLRKEYKIHITSPLGLRFVKSSEALLTPESGYDVCYLDMPVLMKIYGRNVVISRIQQYLMKEKARPHWGKLNYWVDPNYTAECYPQYATFMDTMKKFNPSQLFSNIFTKKVLGY